MPIYKLRLKTNKKTKLVFFRSTGTQPTDPVLRAQSVAGIVWIFPCLQGGVRGRYSLDSSLPSGQSPWLVYSG